MIEGVIFDMDGLMTDTERLFLELWCQVMRERGFDAHRDVVEHCIGLDRESTQAYVQQKLGIDFDYPGILAEIRVRSRTYCQDNGVPVKPGLYELLDYLDNMQIPFAVATSTVYANAKWRLQNIGVWDRLTGIVTGDQVANGKPHPEIFLRAAEMLGLSPEKCLVLEDSPHGILAASRAGCVPVMIPDLKQPDERTSALLYAKAERLDQVISILYEINAK